MSHAQAAAQSSVPSPASGKILIIDCVPGHITIDDKGNARIDGMRFKVIHIGQAVRAGLDTPQKLHEAYPQLTLGQICSALAYYFDHQAEFDATIDRLAKEAEEARAAQPETPALKKLRELKRQRQQQQP